MHIGSEFARLPPPRALPTPPQRLHRCSPRPHVVQAVAPNASEEIQGIPLADAALLPHYDAVVIGSGIGGLTAAVGLAKFGGKQVLVMEQHYTAGGFTHVFKRDKFLWNVGVHYIGGGIGERGGQLFAPFNAFTDGQVAWSRLPNVHDRFLVEGSAFDFPSGREAWLQHMTEHFPKEEQALLKWLEYAEAAANASVLESSTRLTDPGPCEPWLHWAAQPLSDVLDSLTGDKMLQAVLAGGWPDVGLTPRHCSAGYYLAVFQHYLDGAYVPAGAASSIAAAMIPSVEAAGGAVVTSADVQQIIIKEGRAAGVRLKDGRDISADVVISNAGIHNTYTHLLAPEVLAAQPDLKAQLQQAAAAGTSIGAVVLYLGLNEPRVPEFEGLGTLRIYPSADLDGAYDRTMADPEAPFAFVEVCCRDAREALMTDTPAGAAAAAAAAASSNSKDEGVSTLQVIIMVPQAWFEPWIYTKWHKRGQVYDTFKQHLADRMLQHVGDVMPGLPGRVAFAEVSSPLSTEHFSRWAGGGFYGINCTPERFRLTGGRSWGPMTPIPGLLLTGQDTVGDGVAPSFMGGILAAQAAGGQAVGLGMQKAMQQWM